jgi:hypothetical protein
MIDTLQETEDDRSRHIPKIEVNMEDEEIDLG